MTTSQERSGAAIGVEEVSRIYGSTRAVDGVTLRIREGEFFSLLGPSGCGKTTLLRILAGFETPDKGRVFLRGEDITMVQPHRRDVNTVFQSYELFPHLSVAENVAYGLKLRKVPRHEREERVRAMLELVGVSNLGERRVNELSGGQQQRIALARALVNRPAVLLLDEPLSALDVKLRKRMQLELKAIHQQVGTTFVYVTHDQEEALFLSDRIAIMSNGKLEQVGTPEEVYESPATSFVADFVGSLNDFVVTIASVNGDITDAQSSPGDVLRIPTLTGRSPGTAVRIVVRPERILINEVSTNSSDNRIVGKVDEVIYLGPVMHVYVTTASIGRILVHQFSRAAQIPTVGDDVFISWPIDASIILKTESTK